MERAKSLLITSLFGCFTHGVREQDEEPVCSPHKELMCAKEITRKTYWLKHLPQPDNGSSERERRTELGGGGRKGGGESGG